MIEIRDATLDDAKDILKIYDYYIKNTAITFEYETPTLTEFQNRITEITKRYPYLVILKDGEIKGYAYARKFVGRAAYDWSCEMTIYIEHNARKCGLGRILYETLQDKLKAMGILNLYACIGYPTKDDEYLTTNSTDFHKHLGFQTIGRFHNCSYKFNRWYNMIWMEKIIAEHKDNQPPIKSYNELYLKGQND